MKSHYLILLTSLSFSPLVLADNAFPCGPPGTYVSIGETQQEVIDSCGQPTNTKEFDQPAPNSGPIERWSYVPNALLATNQLPPAGITQSARYTVDFIQGKVYKIYDYTGASYEQYGFCGSSPQAREIVKRGDTEAIVIDRCGKPTYTETINPPNQPPPIPVTQLIYQFDPTVAPIVVTIKNGVVTDVK